MPWNFCPSCGHKLEPEWKHCAECGAGVGEIIIAPPVFMPLPYPFPGGTLICGDPPPNGTTSIGGVGVSMGNVSCSLQ